MARIRGPGHIKQTDNPVRDAACNDASLTRVTNSDAIYFDSQVVLVERLQGELPIIPNRVFPSWVPASS